MANFSNLINHRNAKLNRYAVTGIVDNYIRVGVKKMESLSVGGVCNLEGKENGKRWDKS